MVRHYKRKGTVKSWARDAPNDLKAAILLVREKMSIREASRRYKIPYSTLQSHLKTTARTAPGEVYTPRASGPTTVLRPEQEHELVSRVLWSGREPSSSELRKVAYDYVVENNIRHPFNREKKMAGKDWVRSFIKRHPELAAQKSEASTNTYDLFLRGYGRRLLQHPICPGRSKSSFDNMPKQLINIHEPAVDGATKDLPHRSDWAAAADPAASSYTPHRLIYDEEKEGEGWANSTYLSGKYGYID